MSSISSGSSLAKPHTTILGGLPPEPDRATNCSKMSLSFLPSWRSAPPTMTSAPRRACSWPDMVIPYPGAPPHKPVVDLYARGAGRVRFVDDANLSQCGIARALDHPARRHDQIEVVDDGRRDHLARNKHRDPRWV